MKKAIFVLIAVAATVAASAQQRLFAEKSAEIVKTTHLFAVKGGQKLYLDRYTCTATEGLRPCVVFVFGGGFSTGTRDAAMYLAYYEFLARAGYDVAAIDYRLGMQGVTDPSIFTAISDFKKTVNIAVEDLYDATRYVLDHADEWRIDPSKIIASGSSAGAITVLQAENGICNGVEAAKVLPAGFGYAGVISFAGAIFSTSGAPVWKSAPCPVLFFHGTSDKNVPYNKASLLGIGFYGSGVIAEQLRELRSPYYFYSVEYEDHSLAETPMTDNLPLVGSFIKEYVLGGKRAITVESIEDLDRPVRPTKFSIFEYLGSNYGE
ncbi:MAG: alpha/beta hydrolase [Alistipes sp.]|nr:alpha/beta hydrolase [Alistipes sp.]